MRPYKVPKCTLNPSSIKRENHRQTGRLITRRYINYLSIHVEHCCIGYIVGLDLSSKGRGSRRFQKRNWKKLGETLFNSPPSSYRTLPPRTINTNLSRFTWYEKQSNSNANKHMQTHTNTRTHVYY